MNRCVVVLGAGRSGTSLLMNILSNAGMSVSENLIAPSEQNHAGGFEDTEIFQIHSELFVKLGTNQALPLPERWMENPIIDSFIDRLGEIVLDRIDHSDSIWGFKDPRMSTFLPLWIRVFNKFKIVPLYILAVREPGTVVRSLKNQYGISPETGQLLWLQKYCDALSYTGANCFVVHYEDWFDKNQRQLIELLEYVGLSTRKSNHLLDGLVNRKLNRAVFEAEQINNREVKSLYVALREVSGKNFDGMKLMSVVSHCKAVMESYKGWYLEGHSIIRRKLDALHGQKPEIKQLQKQLSQLDIHLDKTRQSLESKFSEQALTEKKSLLTERDERIAGLSSELQALEKRNNQLTEAFTGQISKLNAQLANIQQASEQALAEKKSLLTERDERIAGLSSELQALEKRNNQLTEAFTGQIGKLNAQLANIQQASEQALAEKKSLLTERDERIAGLSSDLQALEKRNNQLTEAFTGQIGKLNAQLANIRQASEQALAEKKSLLTERDERIAGLSSDLQALEKRNNQLTEAFTGQIGKLNDQFIISQRTNEQTSAVKDALIEERDKRIASLNIDIEALGTHYQRLIETLNRHNSELENQLERVQIDITFLVRDKQVQLDALDRSYRKQLLNIEKQVREFYQPNVLHSAAVCFTHLERAYQAVIHSARWRIGCLLVRPLELMLFRWRKVLVTQHMEALFEQARRIAIHDDEATNILDNYKKTSTPLEKRFRGLVRIQTLANRILCW